MKYTTKIEEATYNNEVFNELRNKSYWGEDLSSCTMILGEDVPKDIKICGELIPTCGYIFRTTLSGKLLPARMTMHPKTKENYLKGSKKYGSLRILKEVCEDTI